jgi:hypothetical protein
MKQKIMLAVSFAAFSTPAFCAPALNRESAFAMQGGRAMSVREAVTSTHSFAVEKRDDVRMEKERQGTYGLREGGPSRHADSANIPLK